MRMSSFIAGGVLGMVGAMYLMQNKPKAMQSVNQAMSSVRSNVMNKVANKMTSRAAKTRKASTQNGVQTSTNHASSAESHKENESLIKNIIQSDPSLHSQFEEIAKSSTSTSSVKH